MRKWVFTEFFFNEAPNQYTQDDEDASGLSVIGIMVEASTVSISDIFTSPKIEKSKTSKSKTENRKPTHSKKSKLRVLFHWHIKDTMIGNLIAGNGGDITLPVNGGNVKSIGGSSIGIWSLLNSNIVNYNATISFSTLFPSFSTLPSLHHHSLFDWHHMGDFVAGHGGNFTGGKYIFSTFFIPSLT